ncbi:MAG: DMT family transporter [Pseudomonadota bacterium]
MQRQELKSNLLLLMTAAIWGFAFVAQRVGAQYLGAFTFGGIRFALGSVSLLPLLFYFRNKPSQEASENDDLRTTLKSGMIAGSILFAAAALQQIGLAYTTAGKAAFITGLYIVLVPLLGVFLKQRIKISTWAGVALAVIGLYFLTVNEDLSIARGDMFEIVGAFFWASHILVIDHYANKVDPFKFSFVQFLTCSILSLIAAFAFEDISMDAISKAIIPLLYGGILSAGVAYTLQAVGQKHAKPSHAAIILSMESVFAAIGGALLLHENLGAKGYLGCMLMFAGMMVTQIAGFVKGKDATE